MVLICELLFATLPVAGSLKIFGVGIVAVVAHTSAGALSAGLGGALLIANALVVGVLTALLVGLLLVVLSSHSERFELRVAKRQCQRGVIDN